MILSKLGIVFCSLRLKIFTSEVINSKTIYLEAKCCGLGHLKVETIKVV